ncbi:hypothetical protein HY380_00700, partial [Candidatus Saccharibacteria bacterium]|nr:hypothetical protein [Candidatus Saccharibacteria bacterium]
ADLLTVNTTAGTVTIAGLSADGSSLTNLNASNIASGTLDVARLDASVSLLGQTIESGEITNGTITNDDINVAAAIADTKLDTISTAGKVADTALSANVTLQGNTFNGVSQLVQTTAGGILPVISGANLTSLNGSSIASGTVADARLSANVALLDGSQTFSGAPLFKKSADSTTAFRIQNAAGTNLFVADTTNSRIYIGEPTADATGALLVLDTKNTAGDPTCVDGGLYYNSNAVQARACINGAWNNAVGTNTGTTIPTTNLYDGRTFRLRAGSTPYDFLDLTYDATYGKWVSAEQSAESFSQYDSTYANNTNYVDFLTDADGTNPYVHARWLPWATLDTAGLVPQFRWIGQMYNRPAGGSTAYIKLAYRGVNASEKYGVRAFVEVGGEVTTTAAPASLVTKDTGWVQIPGGYTVKDFIVPHLIGKATSGQSVAFGGEILVRWVSQ